MTWIKRNLYFLIGSLIALGLMGGGIYYLLGQLSTHDQILKDIESSYSELKRLQGLSPNPGSDKVDNIKAAKEQEAVLKDYAARERAVFQPIPPIPDESGKKITDQDFAQELRTTIAGLRRSATQQSVVIPTNYYFTFKAQETSVLFEAGSLESLASHLGEIDALSELLFAAKINFLDGIQREVIAQTQDNNLADYLGEKSVTTPLATITPYRISFRCFSAELAEVMTALATSPNGFVVETLNVEPVNDVMDEGGPQFPGPMPGPGQRPSFQNQFGPGRRGPNPPPFGGFAPRAEPPPSHSTNFLSEKQFRVSMLIQVVKPHPAGSSPAATAGHATAAR